MSASTIINNSTAIYSQKNSGLFPLLYRISVYLSMCTAYFASGCISQLIPHPNRLISAESDFEHVRRRFSHRVNLRSIASGQMFFQIFRAIWQEIGEMHWLTLLSQKNVASFLQLAAPADASWRRQFLETNLSFSNYYLVFCPIMITTHIRMWNGVLSLDSVGLTSSKNDRRHGGLRSVWDGGALRRTFEHDATDLVDTLCDCICAARHSDGALCWIGQHLRGYLHRSARQLTDLADFWTGLACKTSQG